MANHNAMIIGDQFNYTRAWVYYSSQKHLRSSLHQKDLEDSNFRAE